MARAIDSDVTGPGRGAAVFGSPPRRRDVAIPRIGEREHRGEREQRQPVDRDEESDHRADQQQRGEARQRERRPQVVEDVAPDREAEDAGVEVQVGMEAEPEGRADHEADARQGCARGSARSGCRAARGTTRRRSGSRCSPASSCPTARRRSTSADSCFRLPLRIDVRFGRRFIRVGHLFGRRCRRPAPARRLAPSLLPPIVPRDASRALRGSRNSLRAPGCPCIRRGSRRRPSGRGAASARVADGEARAAAATRCRAARRARIRTASS